MELSFLTIVVSLAVCSLLVYAVFQYTKVRLNILEHSQKEQALILQEFIEESSTDIHRLYKLSGNKDNQAFHPEGSIILEYANDHANDHETQSALNMRQSSYNQSHIIHLDTVFFQNKKSNLIEISSDSEDTTTGSDTGSDSGSDTGSDSGSDGDSGSDSDGGSDGDGDSDCDTEKIHPDIVSDNIDLVSDAVTEIHNMNCETEVHSDIKLVTVDLGTIPQVEDVNIHELSSIDQPHQTEAIPKAPVTYSSMSVPDLRQLLKEKYKQNPEKHPEIQKLKKAELIYALQTTPPA
jgi:hypothetical protein